MKTKYEIKVKSTLTNKWVKVATAEKEWEANVIRTNYQAFYPGHKVKIVKRKY